LGLFLVFSAFYAFMHLMCGLLLYLKLPKGAFRTRAVGCHVSNVYRLVSNQPELGLWPFYFVKDPRSSPLGLHSQKVLPPLVSGKPPRQRVP